MDEGVPPEQLGYVQSFEDDDMSSCDSLSSVDMDIPDSPN